MLTQGQVGPIAISTSLNPGVQPAMRLGNMGDSIITELQGRYYENSYRGAAYRYGIVSITTPAGLIASGTPFTGSGLYNPPGSGVNMVLLSHEYAFSVAFAAASFVGLQVAYNSSGATAVTAGTGQHNALAGGAGATLGYNGKILPFSSITMSSVGVVDKIVGAGLTGAITTVPSTLNTVSEIAGALIIPPGGAVASYTSTASGTSGAAYSWYWAEVPL